MTVERQVIVTWYKPEERVPKDCDFVVVSISGHCRNVRYDHALMIGSYYDDDGSGWEIDGLPENAEFTVHAWCDLEPYMGGKAWLS